MKIELVKDKHFYERVLAIMLPVAMQQAINMGVNIMDTIMLGSFGEVQLSAPSLANSFYSIFQIFCMGITAGCSILVSQHYGAGQIKQVKQSFALALRLTAAFGVVFALLTYFFPEQIMRLFSKDPDVIAAGVAFLWLASIPLGYVSGIVLGLPIFITTVFLRIDDIIKSVWCIGRLNSGKWIHNVVDRR